MCQQPVPQIQILPTHPAPSKPVSSQLVPTHLSKETPRTEARKQTVEVPRMTLKKRSYESSDDSTNSVVPQVKKKTILKKINITYNRITASEPLISTNNKPDDDSEKALLPSC